MGAFVQDLVLKGPGDMHTCASEKRSASRASRNVCVRWLSGSLGTQEGKQFVHFFIPVTVSGVHAGWEGPGPSVEF